MCFIPSPLACQSATGHYAHTMLTIILCYLIYVYDVTRTTTWIVNLHQSTRETQLHRARNVEMSVSAIGLD